jgi:hypothetical protein
VRFELTEQTRQAIDDYLRAAGKKPGDFLFSGRRPGQSMTTRQYARLLADWLIAMALDPHVYGTHSLAGLRLPSFTVAPEICGRFSFCSDIRRLRARCDTLGSKLTMPSRYRNRSKSECVVLRAGQQLCPQVLGMSAFLDALGRLADHLRLPQN